MENAAAPLTETGLELKYGGWFQPGIAVVDLAYDVRGGNSRRGGGYVLTPGVENGVGPLLCLFASENCGFGAVGGNYGVPEYGRRIEVGRAFYA